MKTYYELNYTTSISRYENFKKYLKKIVLFQAKNKKFKHWSIQKKATINLTTRQLEKITGIPRATVSRYLKRMREEKEIFFSEEKKTANKRFKNMVFYYIKDVVNILKSIAKKKAYRFIKRKAKSSQDKNETLRIYLYNKYKKISISNSISQNDFIVNTRKGQINLGEIDNRFNNLKKPYLENKKVSLFFADLLKILD